MNNQISDERLRDEVGGLRAELRRMSEWHDQIADTVPCDVAGPYYGIVEWHLKVLAERDALRAQLQADDERAWETLGRPEGTYDSTNVQRLCAEVASLREGQRELARAVKFLDMCNKQRIASGETGAMSDAWQWVEEAAREMIDAAKETQK